MNHLKAFRERSHLGLQEKSRQGLAKTFSVGYKIFVTDSVETDSV